MPSSIIFIVFFIKFLIAELYDGDFDNYTLQRQELIAAQGSTFFGNVVSLGDTDWLPGDSTSYTDTGVMPEQIYEYRVAAVKDDRVGAYTDWFRIGPLDTSLGAAPLNLRLIETGARVYDERYEFWLSWDDVAGADDYEVEVVSYALGGARDEQTKIYTDPTYFATVYGRTTTRVRARKLDDAMCAAADDNRCVTEWTSWYGVDFTPRVTIPATAVVDDSAATSTMELREDLAAVIATAIEPLGTEADSELALEFLTLVVGMVLGSVSVALTWRSGMAPLGVGMGAAIFIMVLFVGHRLLGTNLAWAIGAQVLVAAAGIFAVARQLGVLRG